MSITIEDLSARLSLLEDKDAIRLLKARYLRACDLKQPEIVRDCFLPSEVRIAYQGFPEFRDRDAFVAIFEAKACRPGVFDIHHATNWEIAIDSPGQARGRWSLNFRTILMDSRMVTRLAVEYEDLYRHEDGRWWISETVSRVTSVLSEQMGEDGSVKVLAAGALAQE